MIRLFFALGWKGKLILVALAVTIGIIVAAQPKESDNPRPGYYDAGTITQSDCLNQGGEIVGDVCYAP